ncbi:MAG: iron-sulfur cluster assembly accessory protein [Deltaproteobacteria bacterium]|nr:iron-sulfur cluster assembly accessory protein [Deltaproteobacteria bacterium]
MITISESAARKIKALIGDQAGKVLRVKVIGGGCSGLQYKLDVDETRSGDKVFERDGVSVVSDRKSYLYLHGTELDYAEGLMESGFKLNNPNVKKSCGCGASFSV